MKKSVLVLSTILLVCSCSSGSTNTSATTSAGSSQNTSSSKVPASQTSTSVKPIEIVSRNKEAFRLSNIYDNFDVTSKAVYKVFAPYNDEYTLSSSNVNKINVYDKNYLLLATGENKVSFSAIENSELFIELIGDSQGFFNLDVELKTYSIELPYNVKKQKEISSYDVYGDSSIDPLASSLLSVEKRSDNRGLYINCNNPEALYESCLNKVLCGTDITNRDVFFTFEHNNQTLSSFYYGYRLTNEDSEDVYVTVKNLGLQIGGAGSWLGEDEWIKFYNLAFRCDKTNYTNSQKNNFNAYVGFNNAYLVNPNKPITYRIPKGKYIYVMGGTKKDAYQRIDVFNSANNIVRPKDTGCSNGAVLFSTYGGKCYGQFMAYTDSDAKTINESEYIKEKKELGYCTSILKNDGTLGKVGAQYCGYDDCHGVVDSNAEWTFNDKTPAGSLNVNYKNELYSLDRSGEPYSPVTNLKTINNDVSSWTTHINPNEYEEAVGLDMTYYNVTDNKSGEKICISPLNYDGRGSTSNIGNWMVDYLDTITFVNQGDKTRKATYTISHNGVILAFVRDENGLVSPSYPLRYQVSIADSNYGEAIRDNFKYTVEIPPHSVVRYVVDYNLLANSSGYITHKVTLDE